MNKQGTISLVVGTVGFTTFTFLLLDTKIESLGYLGLLTLLSIVCIVIPVLDRLKELDLKKMLLTLNKIEGAKKEVYAKEESLKKSSLVLSELIAATATVTGIMGDDESNKYGSLLISSKLKKLAEQMNLMKSK